MKPETITDFLTGYIRSLSEETRKEERGPRHGFDHIIYEIALSEDEIPTRLSFFREGDGELSKPKKEPEHGVDLAFLSRDRTRLTIFILKSETLTYRNWTDKKFDYDLRRARDQNLTIPEFEGVNEVRLVLAYNKDDAAQGVQAFENFVASSGTKMGDHAKLTFERWNLTAITEKVREKLLSPSLVPESFFRQFTYICWQVGDFTHGSPQWCEVLLPDWKEFIAAVLASPVNERSVRLVAVSLVIIRAHGKKNASGDPDPSFKTGWLDLVEWAVVALWDASRHVKSKVVKAAIFEIWIKSYLSELEQFYEDYLDQLKIEHSLEIGGGRVQEAASAFLSFWHMGRLGILAMAAGEFSNSKNAEDTKKVQELLNRVANWICQLLNANPSSHRPLLDINHIEIFLVWRALAQCGRWKDALNWFQSMFHRLVYRRLGKASCRIIDYGNSWESLFEYLATDEEPHAGFGKTSYLLLMMMEIAAGDPRGEGEGLAYSIHSQLILGENGIDGDGEKLPFKEKVELAGWIPPGDWGNRILIQPVNDGVSLPVHFSEGDICEEFVQKLETFVKNSRAESPSLEIPAVPHSALVLACIKHSSPLPSEFWRGPISIKIAQR